MTCAPANSTLLTIRRPTFTWTTGSRATTHRRATSETSSSHRDSVAPTGAVAVHVVSKFTYNNDTITLSSPLFFVFRRDDGHWEGSERVIGLLGGGPSLDDTKAEMFRELRSIWRNIVLADDNKISQDARQLKRLLISLVSRQSNANKV